MGKLGIWTFAFIIAVSSITIFAFAQEGSIVPSWIKNTAGFWVNDQVSDTEFINALQFMITNGIIQIPTQSDHGLNKLQEENEQLKAEILSLKSQLSGPTQIDFEEFSGKAYGFSMNIPKSWYENPSDEKCSLLLSELPKGAGSTLCMEPHFAKWPMEYGQKLLDIFYEKKSDDCAEAWKDGVYSCDGFTARKLELFTVDEIRSYFISYQEDRRPTTGGAKITHTLWEIHIPTSSKYFKISLVTTQDDIDEFDMIMNEVKSSFKFVSKKYG